MKVILEMIKEKEKEFIGNRYEGEWKNGKRKGIFYFSNADRQMINYYNDQPIGKHVILTKNGDIKIENY